MKKYDLCYISERNRHHPLAFLEVFGMPVWDWQHWWVEVWILKASGKFETFKSGNPVRASYNSDNRPPKEIIGERQRIESDLVAQEWRPIVSSAGYYKREILSSNPDDKEPAELLKILYSMTQQGHITREIEATFRKVLLHLIETDSAKATTVTQESIADTLEKLAALRARGDLTDGEYQQAKQNLLGG